MLLSLATTTKSAQNVQFPFRFHSQAICSASTLCVFLKKEKRMNIRVRSSHINFVFRQFIRFLLFTCNAIQINLYGKYETESIDRHNEMNNHAIHFTRLTNNSNRIGSFHIFKKYSENNFTLFLSLSLFVFSFCFSYARICRFIGNVA